MPFDFTTEVDPAGVNRFRILGIETDAMVDTEDPLGFPIGLKWVTQDPVSYAQFAIPDTIYGPRHKKCRIGIDVKSRRDDKSRHVRRNAFYC